MFDIVEKVDYEKMGYSDLRERFQTVVEPMIQSGADGEALGAVVATLAVLIKKLEAGNAG